MDGEFDVELPEELETGVYADRLSAWHTRHQLVLDFVAQLSADAWGVTARVRVPASAVRDVRRSLDECVRRYELEFGEIYRPRSRGDE